MARGAYHAGGSSSRRAYVWALAIAHGLPAGLAWALARAWADYGVLHPLPPAPFERRS